MAFFLRMHAKWSDTLLQAGPLSIYRRSIEKVTNHFWRKNPPRSTSGPTELLSSRRSPSIAQQRTHIYRTDLDETMAIISPKYAFNITGGPTTVAAKCKALAFAGPLIIAKEHVLAVKMPEAFGELPGHPDTLTTTMRDVVGMVIGGMGFARDVLDLGMHFAVEPARLGSLFKDLDDAGFDFATPIQGTAEEAFPRATRALVAAILQLPADKRIIETTDLLFDGTPGGGPTCLYHGGGLLPRHERRSRGEWRRAM